MSTATVTEKSGGGIKAITDVLGADARALLEHRCEGISRDTLHLPGPDFVDRVHAASDRPVPVMRSLQQLLDGGRLGKTGYVSILPVDQGIEHSAGASFAKNPLYFDPENIVKLALEGGCNAVASTLGVLGSVARRYAHRIPFIMKINHNEFISYPNRFDQILFARVEQAADMGAAAVGATIYFGSDESDRQIGEVGEAFQHAHEMGMATILWCYLRNPAFKTKEKDYHLAADLTGQANHLGVTLQADIIKQKMPENNGGYTVAQLSARPTSACTPTWRRTIPSTSPATRSRTASWAAPGSSTPAGASGENDFADAVRTAVINKRAGGMGLISGRKAFQRPMAEGVKLLNAIQDVYLCKEVTIA